MGRWRPIGLTEGLWREVAAPPPLAFSERSPSPWLRHREDRQWPLPKADIRPSRRSDPKERGAPRRTPFLPPFIRKSELHRTGDEALARVAVKGGERALGAERRCRCAGHGVEIDEPIGRAAVRERVCNMFRMRGW